MALLNANIHTYGDVLQRVSVAEIGVAAPTAPLPTALATGWNDLGWISDDGVTEGVSVNETKKYGWQGGALLRTLRNQFEHPFTVIALEENATVLNLRNPEGSVTTTAGITTIDYVPSASVALKQFVIDLVDGDVHRRFWIPSAEATQSGDIAYKGDDFTAYTFTISPYLDSAGKFYREITDNPAVAVVGG
jgi:hypothetical protein